MSSSIVGEDSHSEWLSFRGAGHFRCLLLGYFEGVDSERGIAPRAADSLSLRDLLGIPASKATPNHSTLSKTRKRIALEAQHQVFTWALGVLDGAGLIKGKTIGVDATTLETNAAMKSIVRREDGWSPGGTGATSMPGRATKILDGGAAGAGQSRPTKTTRKPAGAIRLPW
jgi:hypothetical protein